MILTIRAYNEFLYPNGRIITFPLCLISLRTVKIDGLIRYLNSKCRFEKILIKFFSAPPCVFDAVSKTIFKFFIRKN